MAKRNPKLSRLPKKEETHQMTSDMKSKMTFLRWMAVLLLGMVCHTSKSARPVWAEFERDGIRYAISQVFEEPIWLKVVADPSYEQLTSVFLPEEIILERSMQNPALPDRMAIVEKIDDYAFEMCQNLKSVTLPSSVKRIGTDAFANSTLETVLLSEGLLSIGDGAFYGTRLKEIKVPESVRYIDFQAFAYCHDIVKVDLPSTLQALGGFVFQYSFSVKDIYCRAAIPPVASDSDFGLIHYEYGPSLDCEPGPSIYECVLHVPAESVELYRNAPGWGHFLNIEPIEETNDVEDVERNDDATPFVIGERMVTIQCRAGDQLDIYDANGILIETFRPETATSVSHKGEGIRIIRLNNVSYKIHL